MPSRYDQRPRVILMGGRLARRVYLQSDIEETARIEAGSWRGWPYVPTKRSTTLAEVFGKNVDRNLAAIEHVSMAVWNYDPKLDHLTDGAPE